MIFRRHNSKFPVAFECALLFLAFSVFSWGVQAKVSLYHSHAGNSPSTSSMAKLSTEEGSTRTVASVENQNQPRLTWESMHVAAYAFMQQGNHVPPAYLSQLGSEPRVPGRFNLHGPDLMRRPPPVLS